METNYAKMIQNVYKQTKESVAGFTLKAVSNTVFYYEKPTKTGKDCVFAIRGMLPSNSTDISAVSTLLSNSLSSSARYKKDLHFITGYMNNSIHKGGPTFQPVFVGHSLGGAICDQLLADGVAKKCVTFNPAIQPKDLRNSHNQRYYNSNDFLYLLIGRYASNTHITQSPLQFVNLNMPNLFSLWTSHRLEQFIHGYESKQKTSDYVVQSVVLHKSAFESRTRATEWILQHKYKVGHVEETYDDYRFRQVSPDVAKAGHEARNISLGAVGHLVVLYE